MNHTNTNRRSLVKIAFIAISMIAGLSSGAHAQKVKDPFAQDTWHAVDGTWPGTIKFDAKAKNVVLAPIGAAPMEVTYSFKSNPDVKGVQTGKLTMTSKAGQLSEPNYRIEGKRLTLQYSSGQRPETYVRMNAKEEQAEIEKLQKMIREGKTRPLGALTK